MKTKLLKKVRKRFAIVKVTHTRNEYNEWVSVSIPFFILRDLRYHDTLGGWPKLEDAVEALIMRVHGLYFDYLNGFSFRSIKYWYDK